jgi:organic radical activating enzyme
MVFQHFELYLHMTARENVSLAQVQAEGANIGRTAVFIRFAGCNLWSGRDAGRATTVCRLCDKDFVGGRRLDGATLVQEADALWRGQKSLRFCILTGGEPLLQVDRMLVDMLKKKGFVIAVETNGTQPARLWLLNVPTN